MENYKRIPDSILKNKELADSEKLLLAYLYTYQYTVVDSKVIITNNFCFETQENLADELGTTLRTLQRTIQSLKEKGLIFQTKKGSVDGKRQFKNRKAIIMVDEFNKLPITTVKEPVKVSTPEVVESAPEVKITTNTKKMTNKLQLKDILKPYFDDGRINTGQFVDLTEKIENNQFYYGCDLIKVIDVEVKNNEIAKSLW